MTHNRSMSRGNNEIHVVDLQAGVPVVNSYQKAKGRTIAAFLVRQCCVSPSCSIADLPKITAKFSDDNWRTVALAAGVAVADVPARACAVAYLIKLAS